MHESSQDVAARRAKWRVVLILAVFGLYVYPLIAAKEVAWQSLLLPVLVLVLSTLAGWCVVGVVAKHQPNSLRVVAIYLALPVALSAASLWGGLQMVEESLGAYVVFSYLSMVRLAEPLRLPASRREWAWLVAAITALVALGILGWWVFTIWLPPSSTV